MWTRPWERSTTSPRDLDRATVVHRILCNRTAEITSLVHILSKMATQDVMLRAYLQQNLDTMQLLSSDLSSLFEGAVGSLQGHTSREDDHIALARALSNDLSRCRACVSALIPGI